ncbi:MAG: two-component regulator propeller domain-containing protein [Bacteroidota bacterium]
MWRRSAAFISLLGVAVVGAAQPAYRFDRLGAEHGLSQSTVTSIAQDRQGYLWVGTEDGLNRFDGRTFTVYRHAIEDATTLPSSRITSLHLDEAGGLWVGTMGGLARLDRGTETFWVPPGAPGDPESPCAADVTAIAPGPDGALWTGTFSGGLCRVAPDRRSARRLGIEPTPEGVDVDRVYDLHVADDGSLWARLTVYATAALGVCRIDGTTCRYLAEDQLTWAISGPGSLVARRTPQALRLAQNADAGRLRPLPIPDLPADVQAASTQSVVAADDGRVWMATEEHGLVVIEPATGRTTSVRPVPNDPRSLPSASVRSLFRDRQGTVWVGTTQGLARWQPPDAGRFHTARAGPPEAGGLSDERVTGVLEARDGAVYVGTRDGLNRIDPETGQIEVIRRSDDGPYANAIWHLYEDDRGVVWMGSKRRGLLRHDPATGQTETVSVFAGTGLSGIQTTHLQVRYVGADRDGTLWVATDYGFSLRTTDGRWHPYPVGRPEYPLPSGRVNVFYEDRLGGIWAGTDDGLCRLRSEAEVPSRLAFRCYRRSAGDPTSLGADVVWSVAEDGRGQLWAGTVGGGLARYDRARDAFVRLTTRDGLPNNTVYDLVADGLGNLWATTNAGLARVDSAHRVTVFTTADGLPGNEFDFMASHVGPSGTVYVGGPNGLAWFDPSRLTAASAASVTVTGARVFGQAHPSLFADGDTLRLGHDENFFQLTFSALDLRTPERARYRYRLDGYDDGWREASAADAEARYTRVPPGRYMFEVGTVDARPGGATRLHVLVAPAFWQTAWFRLGVLAVLVAGGATTVLALRRRRAADRIRRAADAAEMKRRVAEGRERERLRLARELHDGPVQDLYRLGHDLDRLRLRPAGPEAADGIHLGDARTRVTAVTSTLRDVLAALRPPVIPHLGLAAALESLARRGRHRHLDVRLAIDPEAVRALPEDAQNVVYRVVQEALVNVSKHAEAGAVDVSLAHRPGGVEVTVRDDGQGFAPPAHLLDFARAGRFGVVGASERAEVVGGHLSVESAPGHGTTVRLWLPAVGLEAVAAK